MKLRAYRPEDLTEIAQLFYDTIHAVNARDYSREQVQAWAGGREHFLCRNDFFLSLYTIVAVDGGRIVGYGNIDDTGYLDHLFVHKDFQGLHIATAICDELERHALAQGHKAVTVNASITAKPFFEKRGYETVKKQQVTVRGVSLTNYSMIKEWPDSKRRHFAIGRS